MAPKPQPAWSIYEEQMDFLCFGHALWEPSPTSRYTRISVGDVGFIRRGQFHFLFSAGTPLEERTRGEDVPATFEPLDVEATESRPPRQPGCLRTSTVRQIRTSTCAAAPTPTPARESAANFSYELTETHGAALVTKYATYRSDAQTELAFEGYTKRHYESWVKFIRDKQYGKDIQPILVTGFDVTKDFAMVAYLDDGTSLGAELTIDVPALASASTSLWGTWFTRCSPHTNQGPHLPMAIEFTPSQPAAAGGIPREFNQCVFIRYFTMRKRLWFFPKVIRAGAGPHDLGSGDNTGDTFPEVMARSDSEPTVSGDGDPREPSGSTADDNGSEQNVDTQATPHDGGYNSWDIIANYVFQVI
ncbi:hypothetical protein BJ322DRAFT_1043018 [Thelephora terrestris]|uniref:Uncharacterized protein n=1 Tax=Thelephora terrestris TaxID=56493 RepID=A0A9P6LAP8_9AGAM|nr:hypothetical protein BJ322DRAFT_1043018 [Thelephora terrestris]